MPYSSSINNQVYRIDTGEQDQQREITIDGTSDKIDWCFLAPLAADAKGHVNMGGRYSLLIAGKSYKICARRLTKPDDDGSQTYDVQLDGLRIEVDVEVE